MGNAEAGIEEMLATAAVSVLDRPGCIPTHCTDNGYSLCTSRKRHSLLRMYGD